MKYRPNPIDTSKIVIPQELVRLSEVLARNAHEVWAAKRVSEGWEWGPEKGDRVKKTPNLVPFDDLPDPEKEYDRQMVRETLKSILVLGYSIEKK
jgi:hypothetical protein